MIVIKFDIVVMKMTVMTMMKLIRLNVSLFTTLLSDMDTSCLTVELTNQNMIGNENMVSKYKTKQGFLILFQKLNFRLSMNFYYKTVGTFY